MIRSTLLALTLAAASAAHVAHAGNVAWSVGINAPVAPGVVVGTVFGNALPMVAAAPVYAPAPVYVAPAPMYAPPPPPRVVYAPPPPRVVYAPVPVYAAPAPVWGYPGYGRHGGYHHHRHDGWR